MKFVSDRLIFPKLIDGKYQVKIAPYHRSAVGVFPGTKLFLVKVPKTKDLIVTPIDPKSWGDLWKIESSLKDKPGAAESIVAAVAEKKVNILVEEGLSDYPYKDSGLAHQLQLVVDLRKYSDNIDLASNARNTIDFPSFRPVNLITFLENSAKTMLNMTAAKDHWDMSFQRMQFFYRNKDHRRDCRLGDTHLLDQPKAIGLEAHIISNIYEGHQLPDRLACHLISDTEEKYIKIRFLEHDEQCVLLEIRHREEDGAIASFMEALRKRDANIVNSYSRVATMSEVAYWYALFQMKRGSALEEARQIFSDVDALESVQSFSIHGEYGFEQSSSVAQSAKDFGKYAAPRRTKTSEKPKEQSKDIAIRLDISPVYEAHPDWEPDRGLVNFAIPIEDSYKPVFNRLANVVKRHGRRYSSPVRDGAFHLDTAIEAIAKCDFVVADVTGQCGEAALQVGVAKTMGRGVIFLCDADDDTAFRKLYDGSSLAMKYSSYNKEGFQDEFDRLLSNMIDVERRSS